MIEADKRRAIFLLNQEGMSVREISRRLGASRNAVRAVIRQEGAPPKGGRKDKTLIDPELLRRLHTECKGRAQRVHEKLTEEEGIRVAYPTLTRMLREMDLGRRKHRCDRVPDEPGAEMQHDTTVYGVHFGDKPVKVVASLIYLRYSKRRHLKFYRSFNRFKMKCFFHEALMSWGCAARLCIIDNTNLARLRGIGNDAVMVPEMRAFAEQYGFAFRCHEIGHSDRKGGVERGICTVESNFLPGRRFADLEDMNRQAHEWATVRMYHRPQSRTALIPAKAFEHERAFLVSLPAHLPAPYFPRERSTDEYGYVSLNANYYWVPGTSRDDVKVLEYGDRLKIYRRRECLAEYSLPPDGVRGKRFSPEGLPKPRCEPQNRKKPSHEEETRLRAMGTPVQEYLDFALKTAGLKRHRYVRDLFTLTRQMSAATFVATVERALKYRIVGIGTLRRIAALLLGRDDRPLPLIEVDETFRDRPAYQEGRITDAPDFTPYEELLEDDHG